MKPSSKLAIDALIFDMDGVIVDSENLWDEVLLGLAAEYGGRWTTESHLETIGIDSATSSRYLHEVLGFGLSPLEIELETDRRMIAAYRESVPLVPGVTDAIHQLSAMGIPLGLASNSNRRLIDFILSAAGLTSFFTAVVSAEEVEKGKPAPDVYLEALRQLGVQPGRCAAVEDSANGLMSASAAGLRVIAFPNDSYPLSDKHLALADLVLNSLKQLSLLVGRDAMNQLE